MKHGKTPQSTAKQCRFSGSAVSQAVLPAVKQYCFAAMRIYCLLILVPFIILGGCQGERRKGAVTPVSSWEAKRTPKKEPVERKLAKDKGIDLEGLGREDPFLPVSGKRPQKERPATLKLEGVMGNMALLGKGNMEWIVKVGDMVEDKKVKEIREDSVILVNEAGEETVVR